MDVGRDLERGWGPTELPSLGASARHSIVGVVVPPGPSFQVGPSLGTYFPELLCADLIGAGRWEGKKLQESLVIKCGTESVVSVALLVLRPRLHPV